jgi:hypothetical protein
MDVGSGEVEVQRFLGRILDRVSEASYLCTNALYSTEGTFLPWNMGRVAFKFLVSFY